SLTVSFLRNSCGLSLDLATSASKKLNIENVENPNSVLNLLRTHGFSDMQIKTLTMKYPVLYTYNAQKIFKPKLEFFKSLGLSDLETAQLLSASSYVLRNSLEKQIIPCVQELRRILGTDENVLKVIKGCSEVLGMNVVHRLQPNIATLISHGVPQSLVFKLFFIRPWPLRINSNRFSEIVSEVMKLGFDPNSLSFLLAIKSMALNSKPLWEQKVEAYKSFGLSEDVIYAAFKQQPLFMSFSEKKIKKMMGFFVNKLKMKPSRISTCPHLLLHSLEKRIIPRCSVLQLLMFKGLIKEDTNIVCMITMAKKNFMERFVSKYQSEVPDVVRAHQG
ncbi:hypothetical protein I3843_12G038900, partial [Carya illinoinensis]